jgi:hypothetical protein
MGHATAREAVRCRGTAYCGVRCLGQQEVIMDKRKDNELSREGGGDARTPDKTIGEVKYAEHQGVTQDERGQDQPKDKTRAQKSAMEGPAAYATRPDEPVAE